MAVDQFTDSIIEIRLAGENLVPGRVRSSEIAELIKAIEEAIAFLVMRDRPELSKDEIVVGLIGVRSGSLNLDFETPIKPAVMPAYIELAEAVRTENYSRLPVSSVSSLQTLTTFSRRRNSQLEFRLRNHRISQVLATLSPSTLIETIPLVTGFTMLYGMLISIGGKEPRAHLSMPGRKKASCLLENEAMAKSLAPRLYTWVGLEGIARWSSTTSELVDFRVERVLPFEDTPIGEAIAQLADLTSSHFDDIDDVEKYIDGIRNDEG